MNCHEFQELMVEALYGELAANAKERFETHIDSCAACARSLEEMRSVLNLMDKRERPDPGAAYWQGYWNRLRSRMEEQESQRRNRGWLGWLFPGSSSAGFRWAYRGVLAVALIGFGVVVGRVLQPGPEAPQVVTKPAITSPEAEGKDVKIASAEACAHQYIEDSQVLLLALVNSDPAAEGTFADWSVQKSRSRELVAQAANIKGDLNNRKQRRLRQLVTELELILLQIANLETTGDLESVDLIRSSVRKRDMMLRINLERLRAGDSEQPEPGACDA